MISKVQNITKLKTCLSTEKVEPADVRVLSGDEGDHQEADGGKEEEGKGRGRKAETGEGGEREAGGWDVARVEGKERRGDQAEEADDQERYRGKEESRGKS